MKERILIVENDLAEGISYKEAIEKMGIDALLVSNAKDAVKAMDNEDFLAVLSNMRVPVRKKGSANKEAGMTVVKECVSRCIPLIVMARDKHHGSPIKIMMPQPMFAIDFSLKVQEEIKISNKEVSMSIWNRAWRLLLEKLGEPVVITMLVTIREKYRQQTGFPFRFSI